MRLPTVLSVPQILNVGPSCVQVQVQCVFYLPRLPVLGLAEMPVPMQMASDVRAWLLLGRKVLFLPMRT